MLHAIPAFEEIHAFDPHNACWRFLHAAYPSVIFCCMCDLHVKHQWTKCKGKFFQWSWQAFKCTLCSQPSDKIPSSSKRTQSTCPGGVGMVVYTFLEVDIQAPMWPHTASISSSTQAISNRPLCFVRTHGGLVASGKDTMTENCSRNHAQKC